MNKSLAIKNKLYLFISYILSFFLFIYLAYFLINGQKGLIKYFKLKNQNIAYKKELDILKKENEYYLDRIKRLQPNTIDLDYLDEKLRKNNGFLKDNEIVVIID
ncbi:MAG: hypothetical protein CMI96_03055 [Pelagibacteraceae bacterium]|nr:hypothetical protein [Pelagibacteraceae bacterium]|tara:strand:+ start:7850 stop:8161 length:312 start_codon:yes stop_codon:yes gene_type:complete